jgi:hypothetical protein
MLEPIVVVTIASEHGVMYDQATTTDTNAEACGNTVG